MFDNYFYLFSNKWTQYKIKIFSKKVPILKLEFDSLKIIESWINALISDLNDEINNYSYNFHLINGKEFFLPKILEDFVASKMKKDSFYATINEKYSQKIRLLKQFINKKMEKENFSKKHLEKILIKVLTFRSYFTSKLVAKENSLISLNNQIKLLNKEIFDRDIKFLEKKSKFYKRQQTKLKQNNITIDFQKIKLENKIKSINEKLVQRLRLDYKNNKFTSFKLFLEIPKKANLKIISLKSQIANLEVTQKQLDVKIQSVQVKNNEIYEKIQLLQQKIKSLHLQQASVNNQPATVEYKTDLLNKTLVNNLTMSLSFLRPSDNFN